MDVEGHQILKDIYFVNSLSKSKTLTEEDLNNLFHWLIPLDLTCCGSGLASSHPRGTGEPQCPRSQPPVPPEM